MPISTDPYKREVTDNTGPDYRMMMYKEFPEEALAITKKYSGNAPLEVFVEAYSNMHKPRVLDKMPVPIRQKSDVGIPSGVKESLKAHYTSIQATDKEEISGKFIAPAGQEVSCDIQVIKAVKALFISHVTNNEAAHRAVLTVLPKVLRELMKPEYASVKRMLTMVNAELEVTKSYYEKQILLAIQEVLDESSNQTSE